MVKNYIKIAFRSLSKNKLFSFINVTGLSIGLACVLVIVAYVGLELSYDKYHENYNDIYRITEQRKDEGQQVHSATTFNPLGDLVVAHVPAVEQLVRMYPLPALISADRENKFKESRFTFVDSIFFETFSFEVIHGNLLQALDNPFSVIVPESKAISYFGETNILGRELYFEDEENDYVFEVTAVVKDIPQNSHYNPDFIASISTLQTIQPWYNNWHHPPLYTYVKLKKGFTKSDLDSQILAMGKEHFPEYIKAENRKYEAQHLSEIHLHSDLEAEWQGNSNNTYVNLFLIIAIFILLIACINFMNLTTAQSTQRAKEVGMRKVMGAGKHQLVIQFLGESFITTSISFVAAFGIAELVLIYFFNDLVGKDISLGFILTGFNLLVVIVSIILVSLLAGLYPAFYLTSYKPIATLGGKLIRISGLGNVRKSMVTFQFFISCLLIIVTLIVLQQINFLRNKHLGFDKEQIVSIRLVDRRDQTNYRVLKNSLLQESKVLNVALSSTLPGRGDFYGWEIIPEGFATDAEMTIESLGVDEDYLETYDITILEGRDFSKDIITDATEAFILNQAAVEKFGWNEPIGKDFTMTIYTGKKDIRKGKVIGVVRDFNFQSLYNRIDPLVIYINTHPYYSDFLNVKLSPGNWEDAIEMMRAKWKAFNPNKPFEFYFLDQELERFYHKEVKISRIFTAFAVLSIIISCLGLFGLSAFTAQQRTKEIGIRKVLGASLGGILKLLSKEYIILIVIANLIAWPLGQYFATKWLAGFAYRISLEADIFLFTFLGALVIALATVSFQSLKAAIANPVKSLRNE